MKDVIVTMQRDTKPLSAEELSVLILSTEGVKPYKVYTSLQEVEDDYVTDDGITRSEAAAYRKAKYFFAQQALAAAQAGQYIEKAAIVGIAPPDNEQELVEAVQAIADAHEFYILLPDMTDAGMLLALAEWVQKSEPTEGEALLGADDNRKVMFAKADGLNYNGGHMRVAIFHSDDETRDSEDLDAAVLGLVGAHYPQSVTYKFKTPAGCTATALENSDIKAVLGRNINLLACENKRTYLKNGVCTDGECIDIVLGADYLVRLMREYVYDVFLENKKVPYTDEGFSMIYCAMYAALEKCAALGIIERDPQNGRGIYEVKQVKRKDATEKQARERVMPDIYFTAQAEGAVHKTVIRGVFKAQL